MYETVAIRTMIDNSISHSSVSWVRPVITKNKLNKDIKPRIEDITIIVVFLLVGAILYAAPIIAA
jgi:hypothetical protein